MLCHCCLSDKSECNDDDIGVNEHNKDDYGGEYEQHFVLCACNFGSVVSRRPRLNDIKSKDKDKEARKISTQVVHFLFCLFFKQDGVGDC